MKTLILGASTNPGRYAYFVAQRLNRKGHELVLVGKKKGAVEGVSIQNSIEGIENIDTVTMYLGADNQVEYEDFLLNLHPRRVIFNPGAENQELMVKLKDKGVDAFEACTLVMLLTGEF